MLDIGAATVAMRNRALGAVAATTGSANMAAVASTSSANGYFTRALGSFVDDGFKVGMEVASTGFNAGNNAARVVTAVEGGRLTVDGTLTAQSAASARTIRARVPEKRSWENLSFKHDGRQYVREEMVPLTSRLLSAPAASGTVEETGLYVFTVFGLANKGHDAIRALVSAIKSQFTPGTRITVGSDSLTVRADTSVQEGQVIPLDNGFAYCKLTIPWIAHTRNAIAS